MAELHQHPADRWRPQAGPQTTFASTEADFAVIGGSPGGGKSVVCLYECAKLWHFELAKRVRAVVFRRSEIALFRAGGIWDRACEMLPSFGGQPRRDSQSFVAEHVGGQIEDQHRLDFAHLHALGSERSWDGVELDVAVFEEIQEFEAAQVWYLASRLRTRSGLRTRLRASCNPEPDSWLAQLLVDGGYIGEDGYAIPERSGVVRWFVRDEQSDELLWYDTLEEAIEANPSFAPADVMSFTFVLSRLSDNPKLLELDPGYRGKLRLQLRKDRVRLIGEGPVDRGGCWLSADVAGDWFARDAIRIAKAPPSRVVRWVRGWDFGSSTPTSKEPDPDWTEGAKVGLTENGEIWIDDLVSKQLGPTATTKVVIDTAVNDGPLVEIAIFQDTGAAGKRDAITMQELLEAERLTAVVVHSDRRLGDEKGEEPLQTKRSGKRTKSSPAKQALARPWSLLAGPTQRRVWMREALWNAKVIVQTHRFPNAPKDDAVDAISCACAVLLEGFSVSDALEQIERTEQKRKHVGSVEQVLSTERASGRAAYDGVQMVDLEEWSRRNP